MLLLATHVAHADEDVFLDGGLGAFSTEGKSPSQVKLIKLGLQEEVWYSFKERFNLGGWIDSRGLGNSSSAFGSYQLGFDVQNDLFEMGVFAGPALISTPDIMLGGCFQFNETLYLGIRDPKSHDSIGLSYNHFSSAGLESPNQGRDFLAVEVKFNLFK